MEKTFKERIEVAVKSAKFAVEAGRGSPTVFIHGFPQLELKKLSKRDWDIQKETGYIVAHYKKLKTDGGLHILTLFSN